MLPTYFGNTFGGRAILNLDVVYIITYLNIFSIGIPEASLGCKTNLLIKEFRLIRPPGVLCTNSIIILIVN